MSELNELFAALAKAQVEMTNAEKNTDNAFLKSKYADLSSIMEAARPHLAKNGLAVIQRIVYIEGDMYLQSMLGHASGQYIDSNIRVDVKVDPNNPKINYMHALGSSLSYLRRYSYSSLVGVAVGTNDDDGNTSVTQDYRPKAKAAPAAVDLISEEDVGKLEALIGEDVELLHDALLKGKINSLKELDRSRLSGFVAWVEKEKSKRAEAEEFLL